LEKKKKERGHLKKKKRLPNLKKKIPKFSQFVFFIKGATKFVEKTNTARE
jgi:hypothetical protein